MCFDIRLFALGAAYDWPYKLFEDHEFHIDFLLLVGLELDRLIAQVVERVAARRPPSPCHRGFRDRRVGKVAHAASCHGRASIDHDLDLTPVLAVRWSIVDRVQLHGIGADNAVLVILENGEEPFGFIPTLVLPDRAHVFRGLWPPACLVPFKCRSAGSVTTTSGFLVHG